MGEGMIGQGVELMLYGMGTVIAFLCLLVFATGLMSRLVQRYFAEPPAATAVAPVATTPMVSGLDDPRMVAAITAAVRRYRVERDADTASTPSAPPRGD